MASHPPRLSDFNYTGRYEYFLTFCTYRRVPHFRDERIVSLVAAQLLHCSRTFEIAIHVYAAMPDHVHVVAQGLTDAADLLAFMREFKQQSGWQFRRDHHGKLWQGSFYDHVRRQEENFGEMIEYVVNNPVNAGLASTPEDYPFWDSFTQTREGLLAYLRGEGPWKSPLLEIPVISINGQPIKG